MIVIGNKEALKTKLNKITKELRDKHTSLKGAVNKALFIEGNNLRNYIIESMQKTPRAPWNYKRRTVTHSPSLPGNPPAIDTGAGVVSIMFDVDEANMGLRVGSIGNAPYMAALELMKKRPTGKRPWLKPAYEANRDRIIKNISEAVKKQFKVK